MEQRHLEEIGTVCGGSLGSRAYTYPREGIGTSTPGHDVIRDTGKTRFGERSDSGLTGGGHENCPLTAMRSARHDSVCLAASRRLRPLLGCGCGAEAPHAPQEGYREVRRGDHEMFEAFDLKRVRGGLARACLVSHDSHSRMDARTTPPR